MVEFLFVTAVVAIVVAALACGGWVQVAGKVEDPVLYQPKARPRADRFTRLLQR